MSKQGDQHKRIWSAKQKLLLAGFCTLCHENEEGFTLHSFFQTPFSYRTGFISRVYIYNLYIDTFII